MKEFFRALRSLGIGFGYEWEDDGKPHRYGFFVGNKYWAWKEKH